MGSLYTKKNLEKKFSLNNAISGHVKEHSLLTELPEMCVPYSVRQVHGGKLTYFNFSLAKEMGFIPKDFEEKITKELEEAVLNQFNIRIINEYDRINHTPIRSEDVKPFKCFSTRYLQLQHKNKQGRTSGDGRAIWNGEVSYKGKTWDLNSRGTGVTCLAPGLVEAKTPLETGNEDYGYSCGLSELPEIYASSIMSERFYNQGISTERILAAIDNGKGLGICVRAHENLLRPAHIFRYLKLGDHFGASKLLNYSINRDYKNKNINFKPNSKSVLKKYLKHFSDRFLNICALAYHKEIFLWLDWDGDNILIDGGIIDYGSVRRFGLHHNKYKYDDTSRFSTNLDEQVKKGKLTVQVFAQLVDFVKTGERQPIEAFADVEEVKDFEKNFNQELKRLFLHDLGLSDLNIKKMVRWYKEPVGDLYQSFLDLKQHKRTRELKTLDGINQWPTFNMNVYLADLEKILKSPEKIEVEKYLSDFTEYQREHENLKELRNKLMSFSNKICSFSVLCGETLHYQGDFHSRLTTSALLDLISQTERFRGKKIQKSVRDCIEFGFKRDAKWVKTAKDLYRDDL